MPSLPAPRTNRCPARPARPWRPATAAGQLPRRARGRQGPELPALGSTVPLRARRRAGRCGRGGCAVCLTWGHTAHHWPVPHCCRGQGGSAAPRPSAASHKPPHPHPSPALTPCSSGTPMLVDRPGAAAPTPPGPRGLLKPLGPAPRSRSSSSIIWSRPEAPCSQQRSSTCLGCRSRAGLPAHWQPCLPAEPPVCPRPRHACLRNRGLPPRSKSNSWT